VGGGGSGGGEGAVAGAVIDHDDIGVMGRDASDDVVDGAFLVVRRDDDKDVAPDFVGDCLMGILGVGGRHVRVSDLFESHWDRGSIVLDRAA
jgi:hypothetical protein